MSSARVAGTRHAHKSALVSKEDSGSLMNLCAAMPGGGPIAASN